MKRFAALILALGLLMGLASGPLAQETRAGSLKICGEVTVYVKATAVATGLLTINALLVLYAIATLAVARIPWRRMPASASVVIIGAQILFVVSLTTVNRQIATRLIVAVGTIKIHVEHILGKLGATGRTQAAVRGVELGIVEVDEPDDLSPHPH